MNFLHNFLLVIWSLKLVILFVSVMLFVAVKAVEHAENDTDENW